jgi:hypothetical protein
MLGKHDAGASPDYYDRGQLARGCAQQGELRDKDRMRLRTVGQDIDGIESKI